MTTGTGDDPGPGRRWLAAAGLDVASAQGIDVSNFQGLFDWPGTRRLSFGVYRLTEGLGGPGTNSPDPTARHNHDGIANRGLHRGAYHFLRPALNGAAQARYFADQAGKLGLTSRDMLWLDNETDDGAGPGRTAECAATFMAELDHLLPHQPRGVYTFISFATSGHNHGLGGFPLWLANPNSTAPAPPPPWARWTFWQWGIRNGTDRDAFNGTAGDLAEWLGSFEVHAPHPRPVVRFVADGQTTPQAVLARRGMSLSSLLRLSAEHAAGGRFPSTTAAWINGALAAAPAMHEPIPAGVVLHGYPPAG